MKASLPEPRYLAGQVAAYTVFALMLGYFSNSPSYTYHDPELALVMVSFSHATEHKEECRRLTPEEIAELPANMRRPMICPRERVPIDLRIEMDGRLLLEKSYNPTGLAKDGAASVYERITVRPGQHTFTSKLRDSRNQADYDYVSSVTVDLDPRQLFVIDFRKDLGGFYYKGNK